MKSKPKTEPCSKAAWDEAFTLSEVSKRLLRHKANMPEARNAENFLIFLVSQTIDSTTLNPKA